MTSLLPCFNGNNIIASYIKGYGQEHPVDSIVFENLQINGQRIYNTEKANTQIVPFIQNVSLRYNVLISANPDSNKNGFMGWIPVITFRMNMVDNTQK